MLMNLLGVGIVFGVSKKGFSELVSEFVLFNLMCSMNMFLHN